MQREVLDKILAGLAGDVKVESDVKAAGATVLFCFVSAAPPPKSPAAPPPKTTPIAGAPKPSPAGAVNPHP